MNNQNIRINFFVTLCGAALFLILAAVTKPEATKARWVASVIVLADVISLGALFGADEPFVIFLIPLGLVWFADILGEIRGLMGHGGGYIDAGTPGWMIAGFGWIILILSSAYILYCIARHQTPFH